MFSHSAWISPLSLLCFVSFFLARPPNSVSIPLCCLSLSQSLSVPARTLLVSLALLSVCFVAADQDKRERSHCVWGIKWLTFNPPTNHWSHTTERTHTTCNVACANMHSTVDLHHYIEYVYADEGLKLYFMCIECVCVASGMWFTV